MNRDQMLFQPEGAGSGRVKLKQTAPQPGLKINSDGAHVAQHFIGRLFRSHVQGSFSAFARRPYKVGSQTAFPSPRATRHQNARTAVETFSAKHRVQPRNTARNCLDRRLMLQLQGTERKNRKAGRSDQEWILARSVQCAPVLDHAQPSDRSLLLDPVVEQNHAVGHVLLNAGPSQFPVSALRGDDRCDSPRLQPLEQPPQFRAQNVGVREPREQSFDGV